MMYDTGKKRSKKNILLWGMLFMSIGFLLGAEEFIYGDSWVNGTGYIYPNSSFSDNVNITGTLFVGNSPVCTVGNMLCNGNFTLNITNNITNNITYNITNNITYNYTYNYTTTDAEIMSLGYNHTSDIQTLFTKIFATLTQLTSIGNWSADKSNFYNNTYVDSLGNASKFIGNCGSGTVVQNITASGLQCVIDQAGSGGSINNTAINVTTGEAQLGFTQHGGTPVQDLTSYFCDFIPAYSTTMCGQNYFITIATGVPIQAIQHPADRPGVLNFTVTAVANTGAIVVTSPTTFLLNGSEMFQAGFNYPNAQSANNISLVQAGFIDTTALQTESVDGVYFKAYNLQLQGVVRNNSAQNVTASNYTLVVGNWYDVRIEINNDASVATFLVYNGTYGASRTALFNQSIARTSSNAIPTIVGRETGSGFTCGTTTIGPVKAVCQLDYLQTEIETNKRYGLKP